MRVTNNPRLKPGETEKLSFGIASEACGVWFVKSGAPGPPINLNCVSLSLKTHLDSDFIGRSNFLFFRSCVSKIALVHDYFVQWAEPNASRPLHVKRAVNERTGRYYQLRFVETLRS